MTVLRVRFGRKSGFSFKVLASPGAHIEVTSKNEQILEGTISGWHFVGIQSVIKRVRRDEAGALRDSVHFYEIVPDKNAGTNRICCDVFEVSGSFAIADELRGVARAIPAWRALSARVKAGAEVTHEALPEQEDE